MKILKIIIIKLFIFYYFINKIFSSLYSSNPPVTIQEAKFIVQIESFFNKTIQFCSGTLITNRLVLTAAHCLYREDIGFANLISLKLGNKYFYTTEYVVKNNFFDKLSEYEYNNNNYFDMAIIIFNNYNNYYFIPFMFPTIIYSNIEINKNTETFAFGYGITEYQQIPEEPHKVSIKLTKNSSECTIEFNFSGTAKSCLGDSGGPVFSYFGTQQTSSLLFIGLSLQIETYEEDLLNYNQNKRIYGENLNLSEEEMQTCKYARGLYVLRKECIQKWIQWLVFCEKNIRKKELLKEAFNSFLWI